MCGLSTWRGLLLGWWLGSEAESPKRSTQILQGFFDLALEVLQHSPLAGYAGQARQSGAGGMVPGGPSGASYQNLLPLLLLEIQESSEASPKKKKRVKILLHVAGNGSKMLKLLP